LKKNNFIFTIEIRLLKIKYLHESCNNSSVQTIHNMPSRFSLFNILIYSYIISFAIAKA
jgi:hypothetical protein